MKKSRCPRCESPQVDAGVAGFPPSGPFSCHTIHISPTSMAPLENYVCVDGGDIENAINAAEESDTIRRKWLLASEAAATASSTSDP